MNCNFIWDKNKAGISNEKKHGINFERATAVFNDPHALTIFDESHSESEDRWITMGMEGNSILIVVCHTFSGEDTATIQIRIFSARKATKNEKLYYEDR